MTVGDAVNVGDAVTLFVRVAEVVADEVGVTDGDGTSTPVMTANTVGERLTAVVPSPICNSSATRQTDY